MSPAAEHDGRVAAVVPTLNRVEDLTRCLEGVAAQTRPPDATIVIDNGSSDATAERIGARGDCELVQTDERLGAPGAFALGMRRAFEDGAQWAWLLDDDCLPAPDALAELFSRSGGERVAGVAPTVAFGDGRREAGWHWGERASGGRGQSPNSAPGEIDWAPFAGLLLSRAVWEDAGEIRADYVLWHADVEYCLRLRSRGWRLHAAPRAMVAHPAMELIERRVLGRKVAVGRIAPWREYYDTRNVALLNRQFRNSPFASGVSTARRVGDELARGAAILAADPAGPRRLSMRVLGWLDGRRGIMDRHPEPR